MKRLFNILFSVFIVSLFMFSLPTNKVAAEEPADINAYVNGDLPTVKVNEWTRINLTLENRFGIDWKTLRDLPKVITELIWPLNPAFPQPVKRFMGPMSLQLSASVDSPNNQGWHFKFKPSIINRSLTGDKHDFTMFVMVDDNTVDYSDTIIINCTRIDALGLNYGYSWVHLPIKVYPESYMSASGLNQEIIVSPKSMNKMNFEFTNQGYYKNVFYLETKTSTDALYASVHQQAAVVNPGETRKLTLSFLTPEKLIDFGTPHTIEVFARHSLNTSLVKVGSLTVITKGFFISPLLLIIFFTVFIGLISFFGLRYYFKRIKSVTTKNEK